MCLAIPCKVLSIEDSKGIVELSGAKREVNLSLLEDVKVGEYVILHAGFAIQKLDEQSANETLRLLREGYDAVDDDN